LVENTVDGGGGVEAEEGDEFGEMGWEGNE
jgi:hypothetical protein